MDNRQWFREAGFGIMVHFGLYALLGGEYHGKVMPHIAEWAQSYFRIPNAEYQKLAEAFNPLYFNADEWVQTVKKSGAKYLVVTAKHHDGFALFHSGVSKFNVVDATPFRRDIIAELATSCQKHDIKLGLYYSQAIDWSHPDGLCFDGNLNCDEMRWGNDWDFPDAMAKRYERCFEEKIKPQLRELLTNYGDLCLIWFDTPMGLDRKYSEELYRMVKEYQPDCLVNSRLGNGFFDYISAGDNVIPEDEQETLFESPVTLNHSWGYKPTDTDYKSAEEIAALLARLRTQKVNLLLNVGPDPLGRFPAAATQVLENL